VKPVMLKSNIAVRQMAELIQCHWCSVLSQSERRTPGRPAGAASAERADEVETEPGWFWTDMQASC
jgi:hypothetical protein